MLRCNHVLMSRYWIKWKACQKYHNSQYGFEMLFLSKCFKSQKGKYSVHPQQVHEVLVKCAHFSPPFLLYLFVRAFLRWSVDAEEWGVKLRIYIRLSPAPVDISQTLHLQEKGIRKKMYLISEREKHTTTYEFSKGPNYMMQEPFRTQL